MGAAIDFTTLLLASVVLIIAGLVYFLVTVWIVGTAAGMMGLQAGGDFVVLTAGLLAASSILASSRL